MRWEVAGADRATGQDATVMIEAEDEASAVRRGGRQGLLVEWARPADEAADEVADESPAGPAAAADSVGFAYAGPTRRPPRRRAGGRWGVAAALALAAAAAAGGAGYVWLRNGSVARTPSPAADAVTTPAVRPPRAGVAAAPVAAPTVADATVASADPTPDPTAAPPRPVAAPVAPSVRVTAAVLVDAYADSPARADAAYKGREVEVTGVADRVGPNLFGTPCVSLRSAGEATPVRVECSFTPAAAAALAAVRPGDPVTVIGHCDGLDDQVLLVQCRLGR